MTNDICDFTDLDREICEHCIKLAAEPEQPIAPTGPGMYADVPNDVYHADKNSISHSGLKHLLETCPAQFRHDQDYPRTDSEDHFDVGTAFHTKTLGIGPEIVEIAEKDWKKTAAREKRAQAWMKGQSPLLTHQLAAVETMAAAAHANEIAAMLLSEGVAERSLYWPDPATGVMLRARPDWMHTGARLIMVDLKSAETSDPQVFPRAAVNYGYASQAAHYRAGAKHLGLDPDPAFVFVVVSKTPPHLVSVVELDADAIAYGESRNRRAIDLYARCLDTDMWPDWGSDVHLVGLPTWTRYQEENTL